MLNASVGLERVLGRVRRSSSRSTPMSIADRARGVPRHLRSARDTSLTSTHIYPQARRQRRVRPHLPSLAVLRHRSSPARALGWLGALGHERVVALAAAAILLSASLLSVTPGRPAGDTGGPSGDGPAPRLAVAGSDDGDDVGSVEDAYVPPDDRSTADPDLAEPLGGPDASFGGVILSRGGDGSIVVEPGEEPGVEPETAVEGSFLEDGTLLKPVAVDTSVADGSALIRTYKVRAGDTLATIAAKYGISTMTLWWANDLKSKDALVRGQVLDVPPVSGLVVEVKATDTLASLAKAYSLSEDEILKTNGLDDPNLVVGQVLILAGARGAPIATPKPKPKRDRLGQPAARIGWRHGPPAEVVLGRQLRVADLEPTHQPVLPLRPLRHRHRRLDRRPDLRRRRGHRDRSPAGRTTVVATRSGSLTDPACTSTYNHMSGVSVGRGQSVGKGQRVGRMGASGYATGSHLHFEVWKGPIWNGGRRVNPLAYL